MSAKEQYTLRSVIYVARLLERKPYLRDAIAVVDEDNLNHGGAQASTKQATLTTPVTPSTATTLAPGPMGPRAVLQSMRSLQRLRKLVLRLPNTTKLEQG